MENLFGIGFRADAVGVDDDVYPKALRTHMLRLLGPKTILHEAFELFWALGLSLQ